MGKLFWKIHFLRRVLFVTSFGRHFWECITSQTNIKTRYPEMDNAQTMHHTAFQIGRPLEPPDGSLGRLTRFYCPTANTENKSLSNPAYTQTTPHTSQHMPLTHVGLIVVFVFLQANASVVEPIWYVYDLRSLRCDTNMRDPKLSMKFEAGNPQMQFKS